MKILAILLKFILIFTFTNLQANQDFELWLLDFKKTAVKNGISQKTVNDVMKDAKFLSKVIEYDRYQPEFYEDTKTYVKKRTSHDKVKKGLSLYKKEKKLLTKLRKNFQ